MARTTFVTAVLVALGLGVLAGCGSSGSSGSDPLAQQHETVTPPPSGSGEVTTYSLTLTTVGSSGSTTVGANSTVIATAKLTDDKGNMVSNQPIRFEEVNILQDGATTVTIPVPVTSTASGIATTFLSVADTTVNKDVVIRASTSINGQDVSALSIFKVVRATGNYINFITTKTTTDPDGNLNTDHVEILLIDPLKTPHYDILQLAPFQVLDKNGFPRPLVPVKVSVYSVLGGDPRDPEDCMVVNDTPEKAGETTVTTDNTGLGVFNSYVRVATPPVGGTNSCSVIYKATTQDPYNENNQLFSYGAFIVILDNTNGD